MGNCQQFINQQLKQDQEQIVTPSITVETTEPRQQIGFPKRPIGVQAPQFSGTCYVKGGLSQQSLKDYNDDPQTIEELHSLDNMYEEFTTRNTEIIVVIDEKIDRIKQTLYANLSKNNTILNNNINNINNTNNNNTPNPIYDPSLNLNNSSSNNTCPFASQFKSSPIKQQQQQINLNENNVNLKYGIFGDNEGKIFSNFKVPMNNQNENYRYKGVYILDKQGVIQYLNIYNSNMKCDVKQLLQWLNSIQQAPMNKQLSLFERIGGVRVIIEAVELFYTELQSNPFLEEFFKPLNLRQMKNKQSEYLCYLFRLSITGQKNINSFTIFNGINLTESHKNINVHPNIFEMYIRTFIRIFQKVGVDNKTVQEIYERFQFVKPLIFPSLLNQKSTFDLLSSIESVALFVDILYNKVLADQELAPFFSGLDLIKFKSSQKEFFCFAFGGTSEFNTKNMQQAHSHLKLNDHHYEQFISCICDSLSELRIPNDQIIPIKKQFQSIRNIFVQNAQQQLANSNNPLLQSVLKNSIANSSDTFQQTLYYRIGGRSIVDSLLQTFKNSITTDPRINYLFQSETTQQDLLNSIQQAMGGQIKLQGVDVSNYSSSGNKYQYQQIQNQPLKLTEIQFSQTKLHLLSSARAFFVDFQNVVEIGQVFESLRGIILQIVPQKTIYEQFGGENGVLQSVNIFYQKIQYDYRLNILFKTIPINIQKDLFYSLISFCVGSNIQYDPYKMKQSTINLHMRDIHYEGLEQNLASTLKDMMQNEKDIQYSISMLKTIKKDFIIPIGTLYDDIGGSTVISTAVQRFYSKLLNHETMKNMFKFIDTNSQTNKLSTYFIQLFGGPSNYQGRSMTQAHEHLGLYDNQFDRFKVLLNQSFREVGVKEEIVSKISFKVETLRKDIVDRKQSIFDRLGSDKFMTILVDLYYQKVMRDDRINFFFKGVDIDRQKKMMYHFLNMMLGGDSNYQGKDMKQAHQHLELNNLHFDVIKSILMDSLLELDVDYSLIDSIENTYIEPLRKQIIIHVSSPHYNYF